MIKKIVVVLMCVFLMVSGISVSANKPEVTVFVDAQQVEFDVQPIIEEGRTLVPMRFIFEALGATVTWEPESLTAIAVKGDTVISVTVGNYQMIKNGETIALDVPAKLIDGRTLVPVRAVSEGLGASVTWYAESYMVDIRSSGSVYPVTQLSPEDTKLLDEQKNTVRAVFDRGMLPEHLLTSKEDLSALMDKEAAELTEIVYDAWTASVIESVYVIQLLSTSKYEGMETINEDNAATIYSEIIQRSSLQAEALFEISFTETPGGKKVLLITYKDTEHNGFLLGCTKYCAFVTGENTAPRYFIAETNLLYEMQYNFDGTYAFSEVTVDDYGNYVNRVKDKDDFLATIDEIIDSGTEMIIIGE